MRREWIEITMREFAESMKLCLPPCGGSGLKYSGLEEITFEEKSPSMRREWIEIPFPSRKTEEKRLVSLHAEGVD